ncbi:MAG: ComEA family DNA-binding protein [Clostridiales bacterium]|nr:ComEA family DNA-binding protein [Clostridiales bacterium]
MDKPNITEKILLAVASFLVAGIVLFNAFSSPVSPVLGVVYTNQEKQGNEGASSGYNAASASQDETDPAVSAEESTADGYDQLWQDPLPPASESSSHQTEKPADSSSQASSKPSSPASSSSSKAPSIVNINTASAAQLAAALPGIGEVKAQAIVNYRNANGPFRSVDELINVKGIGEATLAKLRPYATIG